MTEKMPERLSPANKLLMEKLRLVENVVKANSGKKMPDLVALITYNFGIAPVKAREYLGTLKSAGRIVVLKDLTVTAAKGV